MDLIKEKNPQKKPKSIFILLAIGKILGQNRLFNRVKAISLGEGIQTSCFPH